MGARRLPRRADLAAAARPDGARRPAGVRARGGPDVGARRLGRLSRLDGDCLGGGGGGLRLSRDRRALPRHGGRGDGHRRAGLGRLRRDPVRRRDRFRGAAGRAAGGRDRARARGRRGRLPRAGRPGRRPCCRDRPRARRGARLRLLLRLRRPGRGRERSLRGRDRTRRLARSRVRRRAGDRRVRPGRALLPAGARRGRPVRRRREHALLARDDARLPQHRRRPRRALSRSSPSRSRRSSCTSESRRRSASGSRAHSSALR